jgi:putative heme transporter
MRFRKAQRAGRIAWSILGILGVLALSGFILRELALVVVPLVLALFPATLLVPLARRLEEWKLPRSVAAFFTLLGGIAVFGGIAVGALTLVIAEAPEIADSAGEGIEQLEQLVGRVVPDFQFPGADEALRMLREALIGPEPEADPGAEGAVSTGARGNAAGLASAAFRITLGAVEVLAGILLTIVILFFYLRNGRSLAEGTTGFLVPDRREQVMALADDAWTTLGAYFRGQLLVALIDAVFIGLALVILGIPVAVPLAVIVFFGGLFPILGAVVTGALAVLVAFADGGLWMGLGVAGVVLLVQQLEGNVLEPLILSRVIDLQPLTVILAITLGAVVLGVLGAFLAVPVAAIVKQLVVALRTSGAAGPAPDQV